MICSADIRALSVHWNALYPILFGTNIKTFITLLRKIDYYPYDIYKVRIEGY